ncbi:MAG TPA: glycosyltransferase [Candidatus Saccharimonadales bacterium]|nr:glycosyltransferase [Candidatus Saccharimonadales bacterium]
MKLSVIIPCKNEAGTVEHLLDSLILQTHPADEIIIVDSFSTDTTVAVAKDYQQKLPLKIIASTKRGVTPARNLGADTATGELLLFIDADVKLPPNFIASLQLAVNKRHLEVGGFSQRMEARSFGLRFGSHLMNGYVRTMALTPWPIFFSCFFITKAFHTRIGGFDPELWIMEDYDYAYRARKTGATFGIIRGTYFIASSRRFEEGEGHSILRAIYAEIYRYTHGMRITKPLYRYNMGGHTNTKDQNE